MDKGTLLGAVLGATAATTALVGANALTDAAAHTYLQDVDFPLVEPELSTVVTFVERHQPGCEWEKVLVYHDPLGVLRASLVCKKHGNTIPAGARVLE
jgi:hypothetical protein